MIVNSTDIKNNFGKYIRLAAKEDIVITKNGKTVGKLVAYQEEYTGHGGERRETREGVPAYNYGRKKVSWEEFLEMYEKCDEHERYEYIDGEIFFLEAPKVIHQRILMELSNQLYNWFKGKKCTPMAAPFDIRLLRNENDKNMVQPDLMVICDMEEKLGADGYYHGVPALTAEIVSRSTRSKDYVRKLDLYMRCGVSEYWIVNSDSRQVQVYLFRDGDVSETKSFSFDDEIKSFYFENLTVSLRDFAL